MWGWGFVRWRLMPRWGGFRAEHDTLEVWGRDVDTHAHAAAWVRCARGGVLCVAVCLRGVPLAACAGIA